MNKILLLVDQIQDCLLLSNYLEPHYTVITGKEEDLINSQFDLCIISGSSLGRLWDKVHERTAELQSANERLEQEVHDRQRVETALRASEEKYRELVQNANSIILRWNCNGEVTFFNEFAQSFFGYSEDEIIGKNVIGTIVPETDASGRDMTELMIDICNRPEQYETNINENMLKNGQRVWIAWTNKPVLDENNKLLEVLSVGVDITERKRAEDKLRRSEIRFRTLFDRAADSMFLGNKEGRFVEVNQAACDALGYTRDELLEIAVQYLVVDYSRDVMLDHWRQLYEKGAITINSIHRRKDGTTFPTESHLSLFEYEDQTLVLAVVRDVTERKRAEEERLALERHLEEQKRLFYRETIFAVTDGKLDICDENEVTRYLCEYKTRVSVCNPEHVSQARHAVDRFCLDHGLTDDRLSSFMIGVGEAITNAIKHGTSGSVYTGVKDGRIWVGVEDNGPGIGALILPRATLLRGFSTKPSLGLGYCVMLEVADRIHLKTDENGTVVILEKALSEISTEPSIQALPDTWDSIPT